MEVIHQGWLVKSPPEKRLKWFKAKWRRRYFVLHEPPAADSFPGVRAVLHYYKAEGRERLGSIDLAQCEEVLAHLESSVYRHLFALRTKHKGNDRTYYLAANSDVEMNNWVDCLCQVLGLKENEDKNNEPPPSQTSAPTEPSPMRQPMLAGDHMSSSVASSVSSLHDPQRRNSRTEAYIPLDSCYSDQPRSPLDQIPPAPQLAHAASSHSIPDEDPPLPPDKTGMPVQHYPATGGIYDSPPTTYDNPKMSYVNLENMHDDDGTYHVPPSKAMLDNNENVRKPRVDDSKLYQVPPVGHLGFVDDDVYKVPPPSNRKVEEQGVYDVPPTSTRNSNSSSGSRHSHTDDSGFHSADGGLVRKFQSSHISSPRLYDHPPPPPHMRGREPLDVYDRPPTAISHMDIYDSPPMRASLNDVVPAPARGRKASVPEATTESRYINLPPNNQPSYDNIGTGRKHAPPPPNLDDTYDFPRSRPTHVTAKDLDATPPPPGCLTASIKKHKYANAPPGTVVGKMEDDGENYLPMAGSSHDLYLPMDQQVPAASGGGERDSSYLPMTGNTGGTGERISTDSTYTPMDQAGQPVQPPRLKTYKPLHENEMAAPIIQTHRTRSFKRMLDSPPPTEVQLPTRKLTLDSSSEEEDDEEEAVPARSKPPLLPLTTTSLQLKPPPPRKTGEIEYIDLDLDKEGLEPELGSPACVSRSPGPSASRTGNSSPTDYKEIDFIKTQALSETRKDLEKKRKSSEKSMDE